MTEQQADAHKQGIKSKLQRIKEYGFLRSRIATDTLCIAGFIIWSPPRADFQYNHYKLTLEGEAFLAS